MRMFVIVAALALLSAGVVFAQETTGSLSGRLVDTQGLAVPGATVTVTGPQGARSFVTDTEGRFQAPVLTPGAYTVRVELQGFKTVTVNNVAVTLGHNTEVPIKMQVGGLSETVEVVGTSAVVDTTSTTTGAVISSDLLQRVPVGRRVSDTLYLAPGVSSGGTVGAANPSISGSSGLDNQYVVDGVNVKIGGRTVTLLADAFNLFNVRRVTDYNAATEVIFGTLNPDFGTPTSENVSGQQYQTPFTLRLGARFSF